MDAPRNRHVLQMAAIGAVSLSAALGLSSCTNVAGFVGQGYISNYGTFKPSAAAVIKVTQASGGATLVTAPATLMPGAQHSAFLTDNGASPTHYIVTVLEDQQTAAAAGHSAFRFLNQAPRTGPVDVYMVPGS